MELLPDGQKNSIEVVWEDQQKINEFSSLINKKDRLAEILEAHKTEKEYMEDLALESELLDEDEKIQYKIGDSFVFLPVLLVTEKVEMESELLDEKISLTADEIEAIESQLNLLRAHLYGKFGNNINLERD